MYGMFSDTVDASTFAKNVVDEFDSDINQRAQEVQERLLECARRAVRIAHDLLKPEMIRDIAKAYYTELHPKRATYLRAALRNQGVRDWVEGNGDYSYPFDVASFIVNVPAVWEFEFTELTGSVNDANWCACQYRWKRFVRVRPMASDSPFHTVRIPIIHKENSRFRAAWENRNRLKALLGPKYRRLVNDARSMTKGRFLEEFHKPTTPMDQRQAITFHHRSGRTVTQRLDGKRVRHIEPNGLMQMTGYTPEEFWREVDFVKRNRGQHVQPNRHNPQGDLFGIVLENPKLSA